MLFYWQIFAVQIAGKIAKIIVLLTIKVALKYKLLLIKKLPFMFKTKMKKMLIALLFCNVVSMHANVSFPNEIMQESIRITGKVTDNYGEGLPGVNVRVQGTTVGTMTDVNGDYSITVSDRNVTLVFSYIGFLTQEIVAGNRQSINVMLLEDVMQMDEVVVVGYGTQKKSSLTGAMSTVNDRKLLTVTTPRVENMLNGKVPGVFVATGSGQPGTNAAIIIRGKTTVNGSNDPLWVIDGVIVGNNAGDLNPSDVETLSILKDAASTAIYGSQGSNGVIVVTTKKGKADKPTVTFSAKLSANELSKGNLRVMNGTELYNLYNSFKNPEAFNAAAWWNENLKDRDFNWWDNATTTGFTQDYNVSVSGGNEKITTFASLGYYDEAGAVKGYDYSKYAGRLNVTYKMFDWLTIRPFISLTRRDISSRQHSVSAMYANMPWDSPYRKDNGSLVDTGTNGDPQWVNVRGTNYLYDLQWNYNKSSNQEFMGNFDFIVTLTDWLAFESVNNYRFGSYTTMTYTDPRSSGGQAAGGSIENYFSGYDRLYFNHLFRFNKTFNDKHHVNGILAYEWNEYNGQNNTGLGTSIPPGAEIANLAAVPGAVSGNKSQWAVQSYFTNVHYTYDNRYLLQGSLRRDGASNFGRNNQYGNFFSISGAWNIHHEAFFEPLQETVNSAKLRISYGSTGNRPTSLYPQYTIYSLDKSYAYNGIPGALISSVGNDNMTWETTYTTNAGLDISLFNSRINIMFDLYDKNTSGLLYQVPLPSVWGVTNVWRNVGKVNNKGFELTVGADLIRSKDMLWNIEVNMGSNRNKIVSLYGDNTEIIVGDGSGIAGSASKIWKPGYNIDTWYIAEWAGVNPENGAAQWRYTDVDGNRVVTEKYDEASKNPSMIGAYSPKLFGGFGTTFTYKNFDMNVLFGYSLGGKIYNYSRAEYDSDGAYTDRNQMKLMKDWNRWEKPGDIATHPKPVYNNTTNSNKASSRYLENGSYLKMRTVNLGYNLPVAWAYISNIRLYVSGENLFTITKYSGVDPEIPPRDGNITGVSTAIYPATKKYLMGINVTF